VAQSGFDTESFMILAIDTSSAACTAALFDGSGACIASRDEVIGRGHSERLVPLIADLLEGRTPSKILVGVGPGSFTGLRVGIAAAHGLAVGWGVELAGMSSLALLAAGGNAPVAVAVRGGHGELFVQQFDIFDEPGPMLNCPPAEAAKLISAQMVVGSGAAELIAARGFGDARDALPSAANALLLPETLRTLTPKPVYARAPDARVRQAA
jgi:tRNA threonylcarbamoyl adenosine modification protein YeaZ